MRIGVMSDSHGDIYAVKRAVKLMGDVDLIVHLGDYYRDAESISKELKRDILCVKGNCDFSSKVECDRIIEIGGKRFLATHGHKYNVKSDYIDLYFKAEEEEVDAVLFGHTHFRDVFEKGGITFINPGSLSRPRAGRETYAIVNIDRGFIVPNILELY